MRKRNINVEDTTTFLFYLDQLMSPARETFAGHVYIVGTAGNERDNYEIHFH
jgi:hypothetical protein